ncbi:ClpX, ATPase regulatory subunit [Hesseltinella vesiculosa]|uniref:ClpX, ATPase regulatory subunit n=1 Tax=Hesseltinella vesiculosa TaxID=101127 RepID=A0A1X2G340_9FUNG|nr:ClpX, ATPase regulatory subunit [Hesseltinella vesiculosa]
MSNAFQRHLGPISSIRHYHGMDYPGSTDSPKDEQDSFEFMQLTDPRTIVKHLDDYVIGQYRAKKTLAVAIYNHYNRVRFNLSRDQPASQQASPSVQLLPGSSTSSNPIMVTSTATLSNNTDIHHSTLPSDYYSSQPRPASWLNPQTQRSGSFASEQSAASDPIEEEPTMHEKSCVLLIGPTGSGKTLLARTLAQILQVPFSSNDATPLTQAGYVGEDVESVIHRLLQACDYDVKRAETGIVFIDEIDKISRRTDAATGSRDVSGEGVQQSLLRMLEGTVVNIVDKTGASQRRTGGHIPMGGNNGPMANGKGETFSVDTSNILFILSGAFVGLDKIINDRTAKGSIGFDAIIRAKDEDQVTADHVKANDNPLDMLEPSDLVQFGLIPEFVGRLPVVANVSSLTRKDLVRVLTEPRNSLLKQYEGLFKLNNVDLRFSQTAMQKVAEIALAKKTGARGLRRILENILLDPMYDTPGSSIKQVVIDSDVVMKKKPATYFHDGQQDYADKLLAEDDDLPFPSNLPTAVRQATHA